LRYAELVLESHSHSHSRTVAKRAADPASLASELDTAHAQLLISAADGLPVVTPTDDLVRDAAAMASPGSTLGPIPPSYRSVSRRELAWTVIAAGCRADHVPVVEAALLACLEPAFNLLAIQTTTEPAAALIVVNGPARHRLSLNCGSNLLGGGPWANVAVGRALRMILTVYGGAVPGETDMATFGHPGKLGYCLAENEEASPWPAFHLERGFSAAESSVTVVGADGPINVCYGGSEAAELLALIAATMAVPGSNNALVAGEMVVILSPQHAAMLARAGYEKAEVRTYLAQHARLPLHALPHWSAERVREMRGCNREDGPEYAHMVDGPASVLLLVAGGIGAHSTVIPTFGSTNAVTKPLLLPSVEAERETERDA
jgi:hypothetical protein